MPGLADSSFRFEVAEVKDLSSPALDRVRSLFRASYRSPNDAYLERSLARLRYIARAYGVDQFDPETFVCAGSGTPMGPIIDVDVQPDEWEAFAQVDPQRGDCLLGLLWTPDAPDGW